MLQCGAGGRLLFGMATVTPGVTASSSTRREHHTVAHRTRTFGALGLVAMLVAAGCGGGDESGEPGATTEQAQTATDPAAPDTGAVTTSPATVDDTPTTTTGDGATTTTGDAATTAPPAGEPPTPMPSTASLESVRIGFDMFADVAKPTNVAWRPGDDAMYVTTQPGPIYRIAGAERSVVLDLTNDTFPDAPGSERGILGIAFDPRDGRMFINYTDANDDTRVVSYELDGNVAVPESRREVLFIEQPGVGHNGGDLYFEPSGNLIISSGDGGGSNGRDAQDTTKLLGALLRIEPRLAGDGYLIPADNPFADGVGDRPEVLARGFRNPWTFTVDDATGDIWVGDVGNEIMEEISVMRKDQWGGNFGWPYWEGTTDRNSAEAPEGVIPPVFAYDRSIGVAAMAGHVYRGERIPGLQGAVLFADLGGPVWALGTEGPVRVESEMIRTVTGFAEGPDNEQYLLGFEGIFSIVPR
jgi:glucose/arabinose dehydrogenase